MEDILFRPIRKEEYPLLEEFLYLALYVHKGEMPFPRDITRKPELIIYYKDFGQKHDTCQVAVNSEGTVIGAAWARIMHDYGYVDDETPSITISLLEEYRGKKIGTKLFESLLEALKKTL